MSSSAAAAPPPPPPPEYLSFSYLRSRKLEPYLPPPPDQHQPTAYSSLHNLYQPPQPQQQQQRQQQQHHHHHQGGGETHPQAQTSPDSPPPPAEEGEENESNTEDDNDQQQPSDPSEEPDWKPRPFVTLTYAQSLDSMLSTAPGARTPISSAPTKAMTHFLRSRHDAVLVGVGTAAADDPALGCRLEVEMGGGHRPRPVVLDPFARWDVGPGSRVVALARGGRGLGPWVVHMDRVVPGAEKVRAVEEVGGRFIGVGLTEWAVDEEWEGENGEGEGGEGEAEKRGGTRYSLTWDSIFAVLWEEGINSVMVEGGGMVINDLLLLANKGLDVVDSVIITIAPVWLGAGGVAVAPQRPVDSGSGRAVAGPRLTDVTWNQMGDDMVLCGRLMR